MSIRNCFNGTDIELNTDVYAKEDVAAIAAILSEIEKMQEAGINISFQNDEGMMSFFNESRDLLESKDVTKLYEEGKEDFLFLNEPGAVTEDAIVAGAPLRMLFLNGSKKKNFSARTILENLRANSSKFTPEFVKFIDELIPSLTASNAKVKIIPTSRLVKADTLMQYDPLTNTIEMSLDALNEQRAEQALVGFMHEMFHSTTVKAYKAPTTQAERDFRDFINSEYSRLRDLAKDNDSYGFTNELEFIAEIASNPDFRAELRKQGNILDRIVNFIKRILGLSDNVDKIVKAIYDVSTSSNYTGGLSISILETKKGNEREYYKKRNIQEKLEFQINSIKDNLENTIRAYDAIIRKYKNTEDAEEHRNKIADILNMVEQLDETEQWKAITVFITQLDQNLTNLELRIDSQDIMEGDPAHNIEVFRNALSANALVNDIQALLADAKVKARAKKLTDITEEEIKELQNTLKKSQGKFAAIDLELSSNNKEYFKQRFNNRTFAAKVVEDFRRELIKEYNESGRDPKQRDAWVSNQLNNERADEVDALVEEYVEQMSEEVGRDINYATLMFNSAINTNSKLIQLFQQLINQMRERIVARTREIDLDLRELFVNYNEKHGTGNPAEMYKNLYQVVNGQTYLVGEYNAEFWNEYQKVSQAHLAAREEFMKNDPTPGEIAAWMRESQFTKWQKENIIVNEDGTEAPASKWKTDFSKFTKDELAALNKFRDITYQTNKQTFATGRSSLITNGPANTVFYKLPSVTKSELERVLGGEVKGAIKDRWRDLTQIRVDDVGYVKDQGKDKVRERYTAPDGSPIQSIRVHFRGELAADQQSLDLFTIYRLEARNGINYQEKTNEELSFKTILEVAKNKDYYQTTGFGKTLLGKFIKRNRDLQSKKGQDSNTYKRLKGMMDSQIYDILHEHAGTVGRFDVNKIINTLNGWTASVGMTLNEVTAATNVLNGKAQLFLEAIAGNIITKNSILEAEKRYFKDIKNIFSDINSPIKTSFTNQLTEMYDVFGLISVSAKQAFIKNNMAKANLNMNSLQFLQEGGEHWMQSVLTMAILTEVKVMNKDGEFIDKEGNVVGTKEEAASLLDMHYMEKGRLRVSNLVGYTTRSQGVLYHKGGKEMINNLVKKKIFDTMGNYDSNMQPEAMRHWHGKLFMMYRKYLVPMGVTRWRGAVTLGSKREDLEEYQVFYNEALQEYEEGFYTTGLRFLFHNVIPRGRKLQFQMLSTDWQNLSDYERGNIKKATVEFMITSTILPLMRTLMLIMAGGEDGSPPDEDDQRLAWFILLELRRVESELSAYRDIREQFRILQSPIPSVRMVENGINLITRMISPARLGERYKQGRRKDQLKIVRDFQKIMPVLNATNVSYKEKYEFIENITSR